MEVPASGPAPAHLCSKAHLINVLAAVFLHGEKGSYQATLQRSAVTGEAVAAQSF